MAENQEQQEVNLNEEQPNDLQEVQINTNTEEQVNVQQEQQQNQEQQNYDQTQQQPIEYQPAEQTQEQQNNQQTYEQQQQQQQQSEPQQLYSSKPQISLINPIISEDTFRYVKYTITGYDRDGNFEKSRRYNDFYNLKICLTKRWPGCFIPAIPLKKKSNDNFQPQFIERRRKKLEAFLRKIAELPHLYYSDEFQIFIKSDTPDIEKSLNSLKKQHKLELIQKYKDNFMYLQEITPTTDIICKISDFNQFLQQHTIVLKNYKEMCNNASVQRVKLNEQLGTFYNFCMPDYEKNCLIEYVNGEEETLFGNTNQFDLNDLQQQIKQLNSYENAFQEMADYITAEEESINAFVDTLNQQKIIEKEKEKMLKKKTELQIQHQKVVAGKKTFKSFFTGGSKEQQAFQLQQQINDAEKELNQTTELCNIINVILGYMEIDKYKNEQAKEYFSLLQTMGELETEYNDLIMKIWLHVQNHNNVKIIQ